MQFVHVVYLLVHSLLCTKMLKDLAWPVPLMFCIGGKIFGKINAKYFISSGTFCCIPCFVERSMRLLCSHGGSQELASSTSVETCLWKLGVRCAPHFLISAPPRETGWM